MVYRFSLPSYRLFLVEVVALSPILPCSSAPEGDNTSRQKAQREIESVSQKICFLPKVQTSVRKYYFVSFSFSFLIKMKRGSLHCITFLFSGFHSYYRNGQNWTIMIIVYFFLLLQSNISNIKSDSVINRAFCTIPWLWQLGEKEKTNKYY